MPAKILVIDDEESMCNFMEIMLSKEGYQVETVSSAPKGAQMARENDYDLIIADLNMPRMTGIEVLKDVRSVKQNQELVVMTAFASVDTAIEAMKQGASDYITKPFKVDEIKLVIEKTIDRHKLKAENSSLKQQLAIEHSFDTFIGISEVAVKLKDLCRQVSVSDSTILIRGESGTGKDLIAKAIHNHSDRVSNPFIAVNCGALPENLLESELFGHKKGSFTGAIKDKEGLFKAAHGGTLFLDEIGNTSLAIQVKLLRVLEDHFITPVGETTPIEVDVRLVAATNSDLERDVQEGRFRADLYYRLNVIPVDIPPLRERKEDIELLVNHFIGKFCQRAGIPPKQITPSAMKLLSKADWPGNVRELENTLERAVLLCKREKLDDEDFADRLRSTQKSTVVNNDPATNPTLESIEKAYIHFVMSQNDGKKSKVAKILGIDTSTLYRKLERYNLSDFLKKQVGKNKEKN